MDLYGDSNKLIKIIKIREKKFDKKQHMVDNYLDMIRLLGHKYKTNQLEELNNIPDESKEPINDYLKQNKIKKKDLIIGLTPGVAESAKNRMWYEDRFANLADKLIKENKAKILFIDGPSNRDVVSSIISQMKEKSNVFEPKFKLQETFYLISKCSIFISNDTGPMHIAAAQGCKTIGLFGPNTPVLWGPYGKNNISIYKTKLSPCIENDKGIAPNINREEYMGPITVNDVYNAVIKLLKS